MSCLPGMLIKPIFIPESYMIMAGCTSVAFGLYRSCECVYNNYPDYEMYRTDVAAWIAGAVQGFFLGFTVGLTYPFWVLSIPLIKFTRYIKDKTLKLQKNN